MATFSRSKTRRSTSPLRRSAPGSLLKGSRNDFKSASARGLAASFDTGRKGAGLSTGELLKIENEYIRNLQQQIYFLELEANYFAQPFPPKQRLKIRTEKEFKMLKANSHNIISYNHPVLRDQTKKATIIPPRVTEEADKMMRKLRALQSDVDDRVSELAKKETAIRVFEDEREVAIRKLRDAEESHAAEKRQLVNEIVSLKKEKDGYERNSSRREVHVKQIQNEAHRGLDALHDSEGAIQILRNQLDDKTEEFNRYRVQLEESRSECLKYQTQLRELEERFFHSDAKSKEEIGGELREEIRQLRLEYRQKEINAEQDRTLRAKIQDDCTSLIKENAALAAQVVELRKHIDADRAHQEEKVVRRQANLQELVTLKDSEKRLQHELEVTKTQLRNEQQKYRETVQKLNREEQSSIQVRLSKNKLRSNMEELENHNTLQSDENIALQRDKLLLTDEMCDLQTKLDDNNEEVNELKTRLHDAESRCSQFEAKVRMQKSLESIKWEEFHKLAHTMSEFSQSMSPTRRKDMDFEG